MMARTGEPGLTGEDTTAASELLVLPREDMYVTGRQQQDIPSLPPAHERAQDTHAGVPGLRFGDSAHFPQTYGDAFLFLADLDMT